MRHRVLTLGPDNEPLWMPLSVHRHGTHWAAIIVGDDVAPPELGTLTGLTVLGATAKDVEREATAYVGMSAPVN